jgi:single stranded DNA-binding protein
MARGLNNVYLVGTLTQAPELRYTPGGLAILELNLAGNDHVIGDDGQPRELAWYHRATVFGAQGESLANQLGEGTPVYVEGRLNYRSWEAPDGQKRASLDVNASGSRSSGSADAAISRPSSTRGASSGCATRSTRSCSSATSRATRSSATRRAGAP